MTVRCSNTELQKTWKFGSSNTFNQETWQFWIHVQI